MASNTYDSQYAYVPGQEEHYKAPDVTVSAEAVSARPRSWSVGRKRSYRPSVVSTPVLIFFLLVALTLIGLIEYACRTLPTESFKPKALVLRSVIEVRQVASAEDADVSMPLITPSPVVDSAPEGNEDDVETPTPPHTSMESRPAEDYLNRTPEQDQPSEDYLNRTPDKKTDPLMAPAPSSDDYLDRAPQASSRPPEDYLDRTPQKKEPDRSTVGASVSDDYLDRKPNTPTSPPDQARPSEGGDGDRPSDDGPTRRVDTDDAAATPDPDDSPRGDSTSGPSDPSDSGEPSRDGGPSGGDTPSEDSSEAAAPAEGSPPESSPKEPPSDDSSSSSSSSSSSLSSSEDSTEDSPGQPVPHSPDSDKSPPLSSHSSHSPLPANTSPGDGHLSRTAPDDSSLQGSAAGADPDAYLNRAVETPKIAASRASTDHVSRNTVDDHRPMGAPKSKYLDKEVSVDPDKAGAVPPSKYFDRAVTTDASGETTTRHETEPAVTGEAQSDAEEGVEEKMEQIVTTDASGATVTGFDVVTTNASGATRNALAVVTTDASGAKVTGFDVETTDASGSTLTTFETASSDLRGTRTAGQEDFTELARPESDYMARQAEGRPSVTTGTRTFNPTSAEGRVFATEGPNRVDRPVVYLTDQKYFVGAYLPTLLAIVYRVLIGMVYSATKMMEPFYCLAEPAGALAKDFLNINYLSTNDSLDPFVAMFKGHWLMLTVSILYAGVGLLTPFASELLNFQKFCNSHGECGPEMQVNPIIGRILQGLLSFAAVMLVSFWLIQRRHRSGMHADPSSIATMASVFHHPEVVDAFRRIDPDATKEEIERALSGKRYRLDSYVHVDGSERYGVVELHDGYVRDYGSAYAPVRTYDSPAPAERSVRRRKFHKICRLSRDAVFGAITLATLVIVTYYYLVGRDSAFERFMSREGFGAKFMMSLIGMLIHSQWRRIERETCIIQPFRTLAQGRASAKSSILIGRALHPITAFLMAIPRRHVFVWLIAAVAILAEVLIVTLAGVPFSSGQIHIAFRICSLTSIVILGTMLVVLAVVWIRSRSDPGLPRSPNTIAAVFSYLCGSAAHGGTLLDDFADLSVLDGRRRNKRVAALQRRYCLRVTQGQDAVLRWTIHYDDHDDMCKG